MGIERLREALEANDWESNELGEGISPEDFEGDDEGEGEGGIGFGIEAAEMEMEMFGMKQAIYGGGEEEDDDEEDQGDGVEQLQAMMLRMQAVRGKCS
jgi:Alpha and gamma adaptin binding protein p34